MKLSLCRCSNFNIINIRLRFLGNVDAQAGGKQVVPVIEFKSS